MAVTGPREVMGHHRRLVGRQHGEELDPWLRRLLGIGVVGELHSRTFEQQHGMVREVAWEGERLAGGVDHQDRVADGMTGRRDRLHGLPCRKMRPEPSSRSNKNW